MVYPVLSPNPNDQIVATSTRSDRPRSRVIYTLEQVLSLSPGVLSFAARPEDAPTEQYTQALLLFDGGEVWFLPPNTPQGDAIPVSRGPDPFEKTLTTTESGGSVEFELPAPGGANTAYSVGVEITDIDIAEFSPENALEIIWDVNSYGDVDDAGSFAFFIETMGSLFITLDDPGTAPTQQGSFFVTSSSWPSVLHFTTNNIIHASMKIKLTPTPTTWA